MMVAIVTIHCLLQPYLAKSVNLNGIVDNPWPVAMAAGSAAVEAFQSHEVENEQRNASQHPQPGPQDPALSTLELVFVMLFCMKRSWTANSLRSAKHRKPLQSFKFPKTHVQFFQMFFQEKEQFPARK